MGKITMIWPLVLFGSVAFAGTVDCSGSEYGYDFQLQAATSNSEVVGNLTCTVTQSGKPVTTQVLQPTSSSIVPGKSIQISGENSSGSGTVTATYQDGTYVGELDADTSYGEFDVDVTCTLSQ